jgi:hypothetical protein
VVAGVAVHSCGHDYPGACGGVISGSQRRLARSGLWWTWWTGWGKIGFSHGLTVFVLWSRNRFSNVLFAIANAGFPNQYPCPNEHPATGNSEQ